MCLATRDDGVIQECAFPFVYRNNTYDGCTTDDWHEPWCSLDAVYADRWGTCGRGCKRTKGFREPRRLE